MKLFVGNLSWDTTEDQLKDLFQQHGQVVSVRIVSDPYTGRSRGFGFVEMESQDAAQNALALNDSPFLGRPLRVSIARKPEGRPAGGQGGPRGERGGFRGGDRGDRGGRREGGFRPRRESRSFDRPREEVGAREFSDCEE